MKKIPLIKISQRDHKEVKKNGWYMTTSKERKIRQAVKRGVKEYLETFKMLANEDKPKLKEVSWEKEIKEIITFYLWRNSKEEYKAICPQLKLVEYGDDKFKLAHSIYEGATALISAGAKPIHKKRWLPKKARKSNFFMLFKVIINSLKE